MISRFITEVRTKFNPFSPKTRSVRLFLSNLPPTARASGMTIQTQLLPKTSTETSSLYIKFSMSPAPLSHQNLPWMNNHLLTCNQQRTEKK